MGFLEDATGAVTDFGHSVAKTTGDVADTIEEWASDAVPMWEGEPAVDVEDALADTERIVPEESRPPVDE